MKLGAQVASLLADEDVQLMEEAPRWVIWLRSTYEVALLVAAVASAWLLVVDRQWTDLASWLLWAWFAVDYLVRLWVANDRRVYVATHRLELVAALPLDFFRPLRAVRLLRPLALLSRSTKGLRDVLGLTGFRLLVVVGVASVWIGGTLFAEFEPETADTADGIWWAIVTTTTVGYGDISPVSTEGRILAGALMVIGIGLLGGLTAEIADRVIRRADKPALGGPDHTTTSGDPDVDHVIDRLYAWSTMTDDEQRRVAAMLAALTTTGEQ